MNNEPIAWMNIDEAIRHLNAHCCAFVYKNSGDGRVPLYTHPAKTLTDEEILDFINAFCTDLGDCWDLNEKNAIPMIRAILRKAQEK